ncbi:hypothetical protein JVU11DRAFT_7366 [Chiua virens]|nr:hypothetical protein JVU11DRAFT_7366 [Chiua virens]
MVVGSVSLRTGSDLSAIVAEGLGGQVVTPVPLWSYVALAPLTGIGQPTSYVIDPLTMTACSVLCRAWVFLLADLEYETLARGPRVSLLQCAMVIYGGAKYALVPDLFAGRSPLFYIPCVEASHVPVHPNDASIHSSSRVNHYPDPVALRSLLIMFVRLTFDTGLLTTTAVFIELVLALAYRTTLYHIAM